MQMSTINRNQKVAEAEKIDENIYENHSKMNFRRGECGKPWNIITFTLVVVTFSISIAAIGLSIKGELDAPNNSLVELLRDGLANVSSQIARMENANNKMAIDVRRQFNESRKEVARLTAQLAEVENSNNETANEFRRKIINIAITIVDLTINCNDNNVTTSGFYFLRENLRLKAVYCQVETIGGNWLVFQQRIDGSVDFYRNWTEYQRGFGDVEGNYWLGLDTIHAITSLGSYQLRVDLEDWENNTAYALYSSFSVGNESSNYRLSVSGYNGTAGDSLNYHNNQQFTTIDRDNDGRSNGNCAVSRHGGWWYDDCYRSNLNGKHLRGLTGIPSNSWYYWRNSYFSLKRSVMKIRPN